MRKLREAEFKEEGFLGSVLCLLFDATLCFTTISINLTSLKEKLKKKKKKEGNQSLENYLSSCK